MPTEPEFDGYHIYRPAAWISAAGEDAPEFLQSQFSNELEGLSTGDYCYGLWLDQKGKVHADSFVFRAQDEEFYLFSYATPESVILDKLNKFIVADDVELEGLAENFTGISLIGGAIGALKTSGVQTGESGRFEFQGKPVIYFPGRRGKQVSMELVLTDDLVLPLVESIQSDRSDIVELSDDDLEWLRIASGCPKIPDDIGPNELPQEGGLEKDAVSFTKGCYLGQEVMSRLHSMGQARRSLRIVLSNTPLERETLLYHGEKKAGVMKTSFSMGGSVIGLALISNVVPEGCKLRAGSPDSSAVVSLK